MMTNTTQITPATTARKATARVTTRAGRDTGYHLVPAQRAPCGCAQLLPSSRACPAGGTRRAGESASRPARQCAWWRIAHVRPDRDGSAGAPATLRPLDDKIVIQ